jgi:GTP-dependent phosphoenolpyruvate carboxykinase
LASLAMMVPAIAGWRVEAIGDDITLTIHAVFTRR